MRKVLCVATLLLTSSPGLAAGGADPDTGIQRIGILRADPSFDPSFDSFRKTLQTLGYVEGRNVAYDYRLAPPAELPQAANDLAASGVDLMVAVGTPAALAAKQASPPIPIVFVAADPVGSGLVASLARPGGNATGVASMTAELGVKRLELLRELLPRATRLAVLINPDSPGSQIQLRRLEPVASNLGFRRQILNVRRREDLDGVLAVLDRKHFDAFIVVLDAVLFGSEARIAQHSLKSRVPGVFAFRAAVDAGGLVSYGADVHALFHKAAAMADKVLKGMKPADLPVEQPERFELIVNFRTAKAIGLAVPESVLLRADEVIR